MTKTINVLRLMGLKTGKWHSIAFNPTTRGCDTEQKREGVRRAGHRLAKLNLVATHPYEMLSVVLQTKDTGRILYSHSWINEGYISGN